MSSDRSSVRKLGLLLRILICLLILKVTAGVVLNFVDCIPPNFKSAFLQDHEAYVRGTDSWAFYLHIFSGPLSLFAGFAMDLSSGSVGQLARTSGRV